MDYRFICLILVIVRSSLGDLNDLDLKKIKFNNLTNENQIHNELDLLSDFSIKSKYHISYISIPQIRRLFKHDASTKVVQKFV